MAFNCKHAALSVLLLAASTAPSFAQAVQSSLSLTIGGDAEQHSTAYDCADFGQISIDYINAAPNFLALVPYEGQTLIFTVVLSASGARYVSGNYEWWTKGTDATFRDLTQPEDAAPLATCSELNTIP